MLPSRPISSMLSLIILIIGVSGASGIRKTFTITLSPCVTAHSMDSSMPFLTVYRDSCVSKEYIFYQFYAINLHIYRIYIVLCMHYIPAVMFLIEIEEKDTEGKELQSRGLRKSVWFVPIPIFIYTDEQK